MGVGHELRDVSLSPTQILLCGLLSEPQGPFLLVSIADVLNLLKDYKRDATPSASLATLTETQQL